MSAVQQLKNAMTRSAIGDDPLAGLLSMPTRSNFDPDAWHVMNERDNALIRDQILHGYAGKDFVYSFSIQGKAVTGVSVVGARELASQYGGIKARIVATVEKRGSLFIFRTFTPLAIETRTLHDLADDDDFYECVMEIQDIKTGNSIEVRKKESRREKRQNGTYYERPHYDVICESKAFRNGVLSVLPQNVVIEFEKRNLAAGNTSKELTIDQSRDGVIAFAAKHGVPIQRSAVMAMGYAEIEGLRLAAADGPAVFIKSCKAIGLVPADDVREDEAPKPEGPKGNDKQKDGGASSDEPPPLGEKRPPAQDQQQAGGDPTLEDAIAAVKSGDYDGAREIGRSLTDADRSTIEATIKSRDANAQPARQRRNPPQNVD